MAFADFYHDSATLELLTERALPALEGQPSIRVWNPGCANGAELYTLAMLLHGQMADEQFQCVRFVGTDVDPRLGSQIADGIYTEREVKRIPYPIRYRYFQVTDSPGFVQVVDELRSQVSFIRHDLLSLVPPRGDFGLILCRDVLNHLDETEHRQVLRMFHQSLCTGGFLAVEHSITGADALETLFEPVSSSSQVYRRLDTVESVRSHIDGPHAAAVRVPKELQRMRTY
jgi:chemotaxis methyl-accepting protein methylase